MDFGRTAADYAAHRPGLPERAWSELERLGCAVRGRRVLDLGSGTGDGARGLARRGARVLALDPSAELLAAGAGLERASGLRVERARARAEHLPLAAGSLHLALAVQCWWWFDGPRAAAELARVLAPRGELVLASHDWLPRVDSVPGRTEDLIRAHNPRWELGGGDGLHPEWLAPLEAAGFEAFEQVAFERDEPFTHAEWRGRVRASAGVGASLSPDGVARFDVELQDLLDAEFPAQPLAVPHRTFLLRARRPGART